MLCQNCNQNEASFSFHIDINGQTQTLHLCSDCAAKLQQQYLGSIRRTMWPAAGVFSGFAPAAGLQAGTHRQRPVPGKVDDRLRQRRELGALKARLETAVKNENYEEAARLRDQIIQAQKGVQACER